MKFRDRTHAGSVLAEMIREKGVEFGSTTGRPRRCGWFDVELLKHAKRINGLTSMVITKLDVLSGLPKIKVAVGYKMDGKKLDYFPSHSLEKVEPVYEELDGWDEDITECKSFDDLPENAKKYLKFLEDSLDLKSIIVSVGPDRKSTFVR